MFQQVIDRVGTLYLDPLEITHAQQIMLWINNMQANQFLARNFPITRSIEESWLRSIEESDKEFVFGIFIDLGTDEDVKLIGSCGIHKVDWIARTAETGIVIGDEKYWSKGIGTVSKRIVMKYAFEHLNLERLSVSVIAFNERSLALQRRAGFVEEGRRRKVFYKNGTYYDEVLFGMLRAEYFTLKW